MGPFAEMSDNPIECERDGKDDHGTPVSTPLVRAASSSQHVSCLYSIWFENGSDRTVFTNRIWSRSGSG